MKGRALWWPLLVNNYDTNQSFIAYFDDKEMAKSQAGMFARAGLSANVAPPVRLSIFQIYLPDPAQ